ncbi:hypothetical protein [Treponema socranskii]|uniref:hypothetical protein n=1 Tax=Treponema socranskii TaxID=53419 RepID=UPI003D8A4105
MKNNKIILLFLFLISIAETVILLVILFPKNIRVNQVMNNSYEINFNKSKDTALFVTISDKGFDSISFSDNSRNQGFITFTNDLNGYFTIYNASLDYAIDNRSSQTDEFNFQRFERFGEKTYCYDIKYDEDLTMKKLSIPSIESSE